MKKFRVVRGGPKPGGGMWGIGTTVDADTPREAVKKNTAEETKSAAQTFGGLVAPSRVCPVIKVFELIEVPEADWK